MWNRTFFGEHQLVFTRLVNFFTRLVKLFTCLVKIKPKVLEESFPCPAVFLCLCGNRFTRHSPVSGHDFRAV